MEGLSSFERVASWAHPADHPLRTIQLDTDQTVNIRVSSRMTFDYFTEAMSRCMRSASIILISTIGSFNGVHNESTGVSGVQKIPIRTRRISFRNTRRGPSIASLVANAGCPPGGRRRFSRRFRTSRPCEVLPEGSVELCVSLSDTPVLPHVDSTSGKFTPPGVSRSSSSKCIPLSLTTYTNAVRRESWERRGQALDTSRA